MKEITYYACEFCGEGYATPKDAEECEKSHKRPVDAVGHGYSKGEVYPEWVEVWFEGATHKRYYREGVNQEALLSAAVKGKNPDAAWVDVDDKQRPKDKELVLASLKFGSRAIVVCQNRKADGKLEAENKEDYLIDLSEKWYDIDSEVTGNGPVFLKWNYVSKWRPLDVPKEDRERILGKIEEWFEE